MMLRRSLTSSNRLVPSLLRRRRLATSPPSSCGSRPTAPTDKVAEQEALAFLAERGRALGTNLTLEERKLILKEAGFSNSGSGNRLRRSDWEKLVSRRTFADRERLTLSDFLAKSHDGYLGQTMLQWTARCGVGFFAMCGAHTAGEEANFHVFGSTLVGCITGLGGGTFNGLVTGAAPVNWVRDPSLLFVTIGASLVGFYGWPLAENFMGEGDGERKNEACLEGDRRDESPNKEGPSALRYGFESVALGALAVVGAQQGIVRGLHPFVSACLGVTAALGGVMRDLMCRRDLTLGASSGCQSYGVASFSGAAVYVALRELHAWNCAGSASKLLHGGIPIGLRIFLGFATVFGVRAVAWRNKPDGLLLTMEESAELNKKRMETLVSFFS